MKSLSSGFDHSAFPHTKNCMKAAGMFHLHLGFSVAGAKSSYDAMAAQCLKDIKYEEFNPVDFGLASGFLESRGVKVRRGWNINFNEVILPTWVSLPNYLTCQVFIISPGTQYCTLQ